MLNTCEAYAKDYNIYSMLKKIKLTCFDGNNINTNNIMSMSYGTMIDCVEQCTHLRHLVIYSVDACKNVDFAVNDLFMRTNSLRRFCTLKCLNFIFFNIKIFL